MTDKQVSSEQAGWDSYLDSIPADTEPVALAAENKAGLPIMCLRWRGLSMRGKIWTHLRSILGAYGTNKDPEDREQMCKIPLDDGTEIEVDAYAVQMAIALHHRITCPKWSFPRWLQCGEVDPALWNAVNKAMDELDSPAAELDKAKNASSADLSETKTGGADTESVGKENASKPASSVSASTPT